jgi:hypothetical protein
VLASAACAPHPAATPAPTSAIACASGDAEWHGFLDEVVTPSFPNGFTVVEATGQWKGQSGMVERERSEIVTVLHTGSEADRLAVAAVAGEYKRRFRQEAVLRERTTTCAHFE